MRSARRETRATSMVTPQPPRSAASMVALVRPVAPRSCRPATPPVRRRLQASFEQQLLHEGVAHLHHAAVRGLGVFHRGEGCAVDAVAPGIRADENQGIARSDAAALVRSSWRMRPAHMALTSGLPA